MRTRHLPLLLAALLAPATVRAVDFTFGGKIQSDVRFRVQEKSVGGYWSELKLPVGIDRNQNLIRAKLNAATGPFTGVAEIDFVWHGYFAPFEGIAALSRYDSTSPYYLKVHGLYIEGKDLLPGLDLRIGQQLVLWGKGDQFNPTNNLNASDIEDPLLFGEQQANLMARVDYSFLESWSLSGVLVPLFKPALLPRSGSLALAALDRLPFTSDALRWRLHAEQGFVGGAMGYPTMVANAIPVLPEQSLKNMQFAFRLAGTVKEQDLALSYYNGRVDTPVPYLNYTRMRKEAICNPADRSQCIKGLLETDTYLTYPRMQVLGFNAAGEIPLGKLPPIGYRLELGVFFPQESSITLMNERLDFGLVQPAGEYDYVAGWKPGDPRPTTTRSTPFAKWTLGLDYTIGKHVYLNVQWVHGMVDEFGAGDYFHEGWAVRQGGVTSGTVQTMSCVVNKDGRKCAKEILHPRLGDYLVLGVDLKFREERVLLRLFTIWDLSGYTEERYDEASDTRVRTHHSLFSSEGFSAVIFPELVYNFKNGFELGGGALLELGKDYTKFGDPATGGSLIWTRARYSY